MKNQEIPLKATTKEEAEVEGQAMWTAVVRQANPDKRASVQESGDQKSYPNDFGQPRDPQIVCKMSLF
ncbi:MAG: hypothetical protein AAB965_01015 [Patescibacteria group bacterium]